MGSIFVFISKRGALVSRKIIVKALRNIKIGNPDNSFIRINQNIGFGCHLWHNSSQLRDEILPFQDEHSGCWINADARIDYREELLEKLKLNLDDIKYLSDSRLILFSYLKWGEDCVQHLFGDFAFAIWDKRKETLFCARDHFGCRPLFFLDHPDYFALSSNPMGFNDLREASLQVDDQYVIDSICSIFPANSVSAFKGVNRLEPAHHLILSPSFSINIKRYWNLKLNKDFITWTEEEAIRELRERFSLAINNRSHSDSPIGVELSGGLDSSSIISSLVRILKKKNTVFAYSHALSNDQAIRPFWYKNELEYSKKIVKVNNIKKHIIVTAENQDGGYSSIFKHLQNLPQPALQSYAIMSDLLYKEASNTGISVLLSGFGGDEGVTYQGSGFFEELMKEKKIGELKIAIKSKIERNGGRYYRQLIKHYLQFISPWLVNLFVKDWRKNRFYVFAINHEQSKKYQMKNRYLKHIDFPNDPNVRQRQYKRIMHPHIQDRLENSYFAAQAYGIECRYPFLDVKLIEFYYSLPSNYKYKNGLGRYLFRMAMKDILPDEIRLRIEKTGATIPNVMFRIVKDENNFRKLIEEGRINNKFHYVDYERLHWMIDQFKNAKNNRKMNFGSKSFIAPISVLLLQKWQREGKIDVGIKC
ncbi:MAG: hypothetical protein JW973_10095 [Bacteroidales bacterium]|nr:hypothetical protein [Bacteroidales bacterium]